MLDHKPVGLDADTVTASIGNAALRMAGCPFQTDAIAGVSLRHAITPLIRSVREDPVDDTTRTDADTF